MPELLVDVEFVLILQMFISRIYQGSAGQSGNSAGSI